MLFGGCGKGNDAAQADNVPEEETGAGSEEAGDEEKSDTAAEQESAPEEAEADAVPLPFDFNGAAANADSMLKEALEQYQAGDYTPLSESVKYNVLWLGFTHVTYEDLDFQMTDLDREYLEAVALNFEKSVESITDNNIDITVELHFVDDATELTQADGADWLYLAQETVQPVIDQYAAGKGFDTVLTTVQTAGDENVERNEDKDGFGINYVMLGLETAGLSSARGYSTFDLQLPADGTYPLEDPAIPSLSATAVAVHEWMHQLEYMGTLLNIEYPNTHAYMGPSQFPGYKEYISGENDYDFFEFYKLVLTGKLPYDDGTGEKLVGMYPKMWPLIKGNVYNLGEFTIEAADGSGYLSGKETDPTLSLDSDPCVWNIRYSADDRFVLTPKALPDKLIDLGNAWDTEGNTISLWIYTGYAEAQSWHLVDNKDGSCSIQTPYESGRVLTAKKGELCQLCTMDEADGVQKWIIRPAE